MHTRREFVTTSALALAGGLTFGPRLLRGATSHTLTQSGAALLPASMDEADLKTLAQHAVDVARQAGASYADIRVGEQQGMSLQMIAVSVESSVNLSATRSYGIRVLVDGVWGFVYGDILTQDRLAQGAREAVTHAKQRAAARLREGTTRIELAPAPALTGTWRTPMEIDPFTVPLREQAVPLGAINAAMVRVLGTDPDNCLSGIFWFRETRIFASSAGALLVQHVTRGSPSIHVAVGVGEGGMMLDMPEIGWASGGFELLMQPTLVERSKALAEEALRWAALPIVDLDVGRYPMVVQGHLVGPLVQLVVAACESDRVLGLEADTAGTSFLTPPADVLRATAPQFSSRMSLHVTPTQTGATSFRWDDEGVENVPYPLIEHGHVVNFTTTRETASILTSAESSPGSSALRGGATTGKNHDMPMVGAPEITLLPNPQTATFDDLVREVAHGILIFGTAGISADTGLNTAIFEGNTAVIKKGIAIGRVQGVFGSFRTQKLWKDSIAGLGDASTSERQGCLVEKAMPPQGFMQVITAPAVLFKDVNVATYATLGATS